MSLAVFLAFCLPRTVTPADLSRVPMALVDARSRYSDAPADARPFHCAALAPNAVKTANASRSLVKRLRLAGELDSHTGCVNTINWNETVRMNCVRDNHPVRARVPVSVSLSLSVCSPRIVCVSLSLSLSVSVCSPRIVRVSLSLSLSPSVCFHALCLACGTNTLIVRVSLPPPLSLSACSRSTTCFCVWEHKHSVRARDPASVSLSLSACSPRIVCVSLSLSLSLSVGSRAHYLSAGQLKCVRSTGIHSTLSCLASSHQEHNRVPCLLPSPF